MSQYEKKLSCSERDKDTREEELISLMEELEEKEAAIDSLKEELKKQRGNLKEVQNTGQLKINVLKSEIEEINGKRQGIRSQADVTLLDYYDRLSGKFQGMLISRVKNKMCEGCRVFLSSSVLSALDDPKSKVKCENCGRYLMKG